MMFWLENFLMIVSFLILEFVLSPLAYVKIWWNILSNSAGVLNIIMNSIIFAVIGFPWIIFLVLRDCTYLIRILCLHKGCRFGRFNDHIEMELDAGLRVRIYNETRATVILLFKRL